MSRLGRLQASRVLHGSAWILIGLGIQSVLGFTFWLLGSRVATSSQLGQASALFTAISFVNYASGMGLTIALARHATDASAESDALFGWGIAATVLSSIVAGCAYLAVTDTSATRLVTGSPAGWAVFCAFTAGTSVGLLVDVRLMAARRWGWLVGRIALVGLVRLPLVGLDVSMDPALWLYGLMLAPLAITGVLAVPVLGRIGAGGVRWHRPASLRAVARYSGVNWVATLASQAPQFVLPLVVAQSVASSDNANFFLAWTITGLVFLVPAAISQVLLVEGSKEADDPAAAAEEAHKAKEAMRFSVGLAVVAWAASLVIGRVAAAIFGDDYDELARLLPSLMLAGIPWAYTSVRLSQARIRRDQVATVAITATLGLGILVPALLLVPTHGTLAASRSWVFGNLAGAVAAAVTAPRARRSRAGGPTPTA
ncbi:MAG: hypothetical protein U0P45_08790 [Acidimicrobiales bacterium]